MSAAAAAARPGVARAPASKWAIAVAVALGALLEIIDTSIVNVALTDIQASLGATLSQVSWVVSSYGIANVIVLPLTAWLGQRFGKKRYFVFSLIGFTAASVLCGLATNLPMLVAARVLQGLCGGGLLAKAQGILFETFPPEEQAMAQAFFGAIVIAGPAIGPTLGGWLTTNVDWRWIFFINVPVGMVAVPMCLAALPADDGGDPSLPVDFVSIALMAAGIGSLETLLEEGNADDWFESRFIQILAVTTVVGLSTFVWRMLRSPAPVVDLRLLRYRSLWAGSLLSIVVGMALYGALFAVPIFAQTVLGFTSQQTGMLLLPGAFTSAFAMPIVARVLKIVDPRVALCMGAAILSIALLQLGHLGMQTGGDDLFWPMIIRAFGTVFMFLPLNMATLGPIPKKDVGAAASFFNLTRQLGGSVGVALLTLLLEHRTAFHRAVLVEKLAAVDPAVQARVATLTAGLVARGVDATNAARGAMRLLDGSVSQQAAVMSFADTFWATAAIIVLFVPLVLLLGKPGAGQKVTADAH